ncbi:MAG: TVP38/TMEM64 family protein [Winogradskyella sp.]|uniref:TVP38/TMEM64 family protein n=1 Tax=Winogradskyella sp. TaxID=1883156 RepID=UPI00180C32F1|nr:TVP38/TMEM64 family protein [Winogradskyella sp.]
MTNKDSKISKSRFPFYLSGLLFVGIVASYFIFNDVRLFFDNSWDVLTSNDEAQIKHWIDGFGWLGPIILVLAMIIQMFLLIVPTILLMVVSILAYGPYWGSLIIILSVYAASTVGYFIGRTFGQSLVLKLLGQKAETKIESFIKDYGFWAVIITRLNPFLSNDAISFVGGILKMTYWKFIGATIIGILPLTIFIAIVGKNTESLKTGMLYGSLFCIVVFFIYLYWDKRRK